MGITLTSKSIASTYDGLLKLSDNDPLSGAFKVVTDGFGNESGIQLNNSGDVNIAGILNVGTRVNTPILQLTGGTGDQGTFSWNSDEWTVDLIQNGTTLQLGQEVQIHVKNQSGATIPDGAPVYATGTLGASGRITVAPMIADGSIPAKYFLGVATETIADGADGKITTFGKIRGIDTSAYTEGQTLWVSATSAGNFQTTRPLAPNLDLEVAIVINSHVNNGTIFVRANNGHYLGTAHDVNISSVAENDLLVYKTNRWVNTKSIGDLSAANVTLSGYLRGPEVFVIDPAAFGNNTGLVQILGDLRVDGTTTTINSTTISVSDKNITLAKDAVTAGDANGAGITIAGANATLTYLSASDDFTFNKNVNASRFVGPLTGDVTGNADTADALSTARNIALTGSVTGNADFDGSGDIIITTTTNHNHDDRYYTETESDNRFVNVSGDTMTGNLNIVKQNVGITTTYGIVSIEGTDAHLDLISSTDGNWGSAINFVQGTNTTANTDIWSIARKTTAGGNSLNFNFGTVNDHNINGVKVTFSNTGIITAAGGTSTEWNTAYDYSQIGHLELTGGTLTGDLYIENAEPKIRLKENDTANLDKEISLIGGAIYIKNLNDDNTATNNMIVIDNSGNFTASGTLTAVGYNKTNWDAAYNYKINSGYFDSNTGDLVLTRQDDNTLEINFDDRYVIANTGNFKTNTYSVESPVGTQRYKLMTTSGQVDQFFHITINRAYDYGDNDQTKQQAIYQRRQTDKNLKWRLDGDLTATSQVFIEIYAKANGDDEVWLVCTDYAKPQVYVEHDGFFWNGLTTADTPTGTLIKTTELTASNKPNWEEQVGLVKTTELYSDTTYLRGSAFVLAPNGSSYDTLVYRDGTNSHVLYAGGGTSTQWNTAYNYSQVGHLPLAGGTVTGNVTIQNGDLFISRTAVNGTATRKIRFAEGITTTSGFQGGYIYYNADSNVFQIGVHDAADSNAANDIPAISIERSTANITATNITATSFVKSGGTSSQFLKADGSVDSNTYLTSVPVPINGDWWNGGFVKVGTDGVMEMGKYMDFHTSDSGGNADYDLRVTVSPGVFSVGGQVNATGGNSSQWNTAYGWGNHASAGYIKTNGTTHLTSTNKWAVIKNTGTGTGDYSEFQISNNADNYLVMGSIGSNYISSEWAGSSYIYSDRELRLKSVGQFKIYAGGYANSNIALTFDTSRNASFTGSIYTPNTITANRFTGINSLVLNNYTTVNPASNVFLYSQPNDRDAWIYLDSAATTNNWGIYHRQIDSTVGDLPANSIGFVGGGASVLQAYISLANGSAFFRGNTTTNGSFTASTGGVAVTASSSQNTGLIVDGGTNSGIIAEFKNSTTKAVINTSGGGYFLGNVGIGTTSPRTPLDVTGNGISFGYSSADAAERDWLISTNYSAYGDFHIRQSNAKDGNPYSAGTTRFMINSSGNVGIGTTSPSGVLHVADTPSTVTLMLGRASGVATIKSDGTADGHMIIDSGTSGTAVWLQNYTSGNVYLATGGGKVGIGTTSPSEKLTVNGNLKVGTGTTGNENIQLHYANGTGFYGALRFYEGGSNNQTIHAFSSLWQGGNAYSASSGCINITGANGVTFGTWYTPDVVFQAGSTSYFKNRVGIGVTSPDRQLHVASGGYRLMGSVGFYTSYTSDGLWNAAALPNFIQANGYTGSASKFGDAGLVLGYQDNASGLYAPAYGFETKSVDGLGNTVNKTVLILKDTDTGSWNFTVSNLGDGYFARNLGIGTTSPLNKLHVNNGTGQGAGAVATFRDSGNSNGLNIFPNLAAGNYNSGVSAGDVLLAANGQYKPLVFGTHDGAAIRTSQSAIQFFNSGERMRIASNGNVGIGTTSPAEKLDVAGNILADTWISTDTTARRNKFSLWGGDAAYAIGMGNGYSYGYLGGTSTGSEYAMTFQMNTTANRGFWWGSNGHTNAQGAMSLTNDGKLMVATLASIGYGISSTTPSTTYTLDVSGTIRATNDVYAYSDARVKENVETIDNALDKVMSMRGVSYNRIDTEDKTKRVGVIAQEIQKVLPEVVSEQEDGMLSVSYGNIVGVLIEAIKEQQKQIDELKALLNGSTK